MPLDEQGREVPDQTPVAAPINFQRPESLEDRIKRIIRAEVSAQADAAGFETFEEANDFEVGEDYDPSSPYEITADQELAPPPELSPKPVDKPVDKTVDKSPPSPPQP